jgi:hypothetical protein
MPNSKHLTHGISNLVSLITKTKLGLSLMQLQVIGLSNAKIVILDLKTIIDGNDDGDGEGIVFL